MKTPCTLLTASLLLLAIACSKSENAPPENPPQPSGGGQETVRYKIKIIDSISRLLKGMEDVSVVGMQVPPDSSSVVFQVTRKGDGNKIPYLPSGTTQAVYPGAIIDGKKISPRLYEALPGLKRNALERMVSIPADHFADTVMQPTPENLQSVTPLVAKALNGGEGKEISQFSYDEGSAFNDYGYFAFARNLDPAVLNGKQGLITHRTGMISTIVKENFTVSVGPPAQTPFLQENAPAGTEPVIITDVDYGYRVFVVLESDADYNALKVAYKLAMGTGTPDNAQKSLLDKAIIDIYATGLPAEDERSLQGLAGYARIRALSKIILKSGKYTAAEYGKPISFSLRTVNDYGWVSPVYTYNLK